MGMRRRKTNDKDEKRKLGSEDFKKALSIFKYVLPYKWAFILGMIFLAAGSLVFFVIMKVPGEMINIISGESKYDIGLNKLFLVFKYFLYLSIIRSANFE